MLRYFLFFLMFQSALAQESSREAFFKVIKESTNRNPIVLKAEAEKKQAEAQLTLSSSSFLPHFSLEAEKIFYSDSNINSPYTLSIMSQLNLFKSGHDFYSRRAAESQNAAMEFNFFNANLAAEKEITDIAFDFIKVTQEYDVLKKFEVIEKQLLENAKVRYQKGYLPLEEYEKIQIESDNFLIRTQETEHLLEAAKKKQSIYLASQTLSSWPFANLLQSQEVVNKLKKMAIDSWKDHPVIKSKQSIYEKNQMLLKSIRANHLPTLSLQVKSPLYQENESWMNPKNHWLASLNLHVPLFSGGATYAQTQSQAAIVLESEADAVQAQQSFSASLEETLQTIQHLQKTLEVLNRSLKISQKLYSTSATRFQRGLVSVNDVTLDQKRLLETQLNHTSILAKFHRTIVDICHKSGKTVEVCLQKI